MSRLDLIKEFKNEDGETFNKCSRAYEMGRADAIEEIISKAHCEDADCFECPFGTAEKCLLGKW